jgi:hypothetical protein
MYWSVNHYQVILSYFAPLLLAVAIGAGIQAWDIPWYWLVLLAPPAAVVLYVTYLWACTWLCRLRVHIWNQRFPPREGVFEREFGQEDAEDPEVQYYHLRGFIYKFPVFTAKKSPFPWNQLYVLRRLADNEIGRDAVQEDAFVGLEFTVLKKNAAVLYGATNSSHVVDSLFGNVTIKTIVSEENAIVGPTCAIAPGGHLHRNLIIFPMSVAPKNFRQPDHDFAFGSPASYKRVPYNGFIENLPADLQVQWREKQAWWTKHRAHR